MEKDEFDYLMNNYGKKIDISFNEIQLVQFYEYMNLLIDWNKKINLTAIIDPEEIILKHFIDSLTINKYIECDKTLVDVGTGAGFPGIPLKIYRNDLKIILVDSLNKRINFLNEVVSKLNLQNIYSVHSRIEDFGMENREKFDYSVARAVANLQILSEYLLPIVKISGTCICMKGNDVDEEVKNAKNAIDILGGKLENVDKFRLPNSDISRNIVLIKKVKSTPSKYPRKAGLPKKEPLK